MPSSVSHWIRPLPGGGVSQHIPRTVLTREEAIALWERLEQIMVRAVVSNNAVTIAADIAFTATADEPFIRE